MRIGRHTRQGRQINVSNAVKALESRPADGVRKGPNKPAELYHRVRYMDPARLQRVLANFGPRSQLLTYIRLPYAA